MSRRAYAVVIPTTAGLVRIRRLQSVGVSRNHVRPLVMVEDRHDPTASIAYATLVDSATGHIDRLYPCPEGSIWRLDLDGRLDTDAGCSWQLGVLLAHALLDAGRLAGPEDTRAPLIWATGKLADDLKVAKVDSIVRKVEQTLESGIVEQIAFAFCPSANRKEAFEVTSTLGFELRLCDRAGVACKALDLPQPIARSPALVTAPLGTPGGETREPRIWRREYVLIAIGAVLAAVAVGATTAVWPPSPPPATDGQPDRGEAAAPVTASSPQLVLSELRPRDGSRSCIRVENRLAEPTVQPLLPEAGRFPTSIDGKEIGGRHRQLCGLELVLRDGAGRSMHAAITIKTADAAQVLHQWASDEPAASHRVRLRFDHDGPIPLIAAGDYVIHAMLGDAPLTAVTDAATIFHHTIRAER